jgi:hypothetical protein
MNGLVNSDPTVGIDAVAVTPESARVVFFKKKVMMALPWGKMTHPLTSFCTAQLMDRRRVTTALNFGDAFVAHSRNSIADIFLKSDSEHLLMIDDDMVVPFGHAEWYKANTGWDIPEPFASFNALDRLLSHGKTLVGALYFGRYGKGNPVYGEGPHERKYALSGPYDKVKPTRWVGTGCILIHRSVFEDIEKLYPRLGRGADKKGGQWFSSSEHTLLSAVDRVRAGLSAGPMTGEKALKAYELLEAAVNEARVSSTLGIGEDVQFCLRAKSAGHQPFVDMGLLAGHIGHAVYPIDYDKKASA